jgi:menaquinone-dependent protoporphyrinogen oxidase
VLRQGSSHGLRYRSDESFVVYKRGTSLDLPILVAYSTRTGSTGEVAEFIAADLRRAGLAVELARMRDIRSLNSYGAVILGAPIYMRRLPSEALRFLRRFRSQIAGLPAWFYVLGPIRGKQWEFREVENQALCRLEEFPWLQPRDVKVFGGRFDPNHMPFPYNLSMHLPAFPLKDDPPSDVRDWNDIRAWTAGITDNLCLSFDFEGLTIRLDGALIV